MFDKFNFQEKMINRFFTRVPNVVWDMMSGKLGIATKDGIVSLDGEGEEASVVTNIIDNFGMPVPAFAQNTPIEQLKVGDLIFINGKPKGWIVEVKEKQDGKPQKFGVISVTGTISTWNPPKTQMLGMESGVMVLKSLDTLLPGGKGAMAGMQGMLMPMMMMSDGDFGGDLEEMLPMLLFTQTQGADPAAGGNMMQMMMMAKMFSGKKLGGATGPKKQSKGNRFDNFFDE